MPGTDDTLRILTQVDVNGIQAGMAESAAAVETHTQAMAASFEEARQASDYSMTEARHAVHGLGEEIGIHVPRFVQSFIAQLGGVGPVLAAAFAPIAVVGLVSVLSELPDAIQKGIDKLGGLDDELKKTYSDAFKENLKLQTEALETAHKLGEIGLIGKEGPELAREKMKLLGDDEKRAGALATEITQSIGRLKEETDKIDPDKAIPWARLGAEVLSTFDGTRAKVKQNKQEIIEYQQVLDSMVQKMREMNEVEKPRGHAEIREADIRADEQAQKEAERLFHERTIAEINDAEHAAKEKTQILAEERKKDEEFYKYIEEQEKRLDKEIERTQEEALHRAIEINNKEMHEEEEKVKKEVEFYMQGFDRITKGLNSNIVSMINGQESFKRAAQKMWTSVADNAIENILKIGEKQVEQKLISIVMTNEQKATETAAAAAGAAATQTAMFKEQLAAAKAGAGKAYQAMAGIPIIGPELGAIAGAATFAAIMAFEKGGIMPKTDLALLHPNEMVLPSHISESVQRAADSGTMGAGGGHDGGHTFQFNHYGPGTNSQVRDSSKEFMKMVNRKLRQNGHAPLFTKSGSGKWAE